MREINNLNLLEIINKTLETRNSSKLFSKRVSECVELLHAHFNLLEQINNVCSLFEKEDSLVELNRIKATLEQNAEKIIEIVSKNSNREIMVYIVESGDSVWEISKKFKSDAAEICELNSLRKVFSLEDKKFLLIPINI